jgi:catechol 2,3-dioxygenase-like lactoylglutathione lyase family enzyme
MPMLDHLSLQVLDLDKSLSFYDAVLAPLNCRRVLVFDDRVGYGTEFPAFWVGMAADRVPNRPVHVAFRAPDRAAVDAFHNAAVALGLESLHEPRVWPEYHAGYYGAFVRDPDGNNVEAVHHTWG